MQTIWVESQKALPHFASMSTDGMRQGCTARQVSLYWTVKETLVVAVDEPLVPVTVTV